MAPFYSLLGIDSFSYFLVLKKKLHLCLVHVIWIGRQMLKLVLNVKYLLLLSFLTAVEFYNLGHFQGTIGCLNLKEINFSALYYFQI